MILLADSGSTKVDWSIVDNGKIEQRVFTKGINPYYQSEEEISIEIKQGLLPYLGDNKFESVHFYGAGCAFDKVEIVKNAIESNLKVKKQIEVNSDMLAAARGLCGRESGIACILGTGSNSCYYNGKNIVANVSPLGFILGDEGSGAVLGKIFISDLLKNQLGSELKESFLKKYELTVAEIIDRVYRKPFPNRFLATFSPFISDNIQNPAVYRLVLDSFKSFLKRNVMQYDEHKNVPVHFVGSIAYYFKDVLQESANEMEIQLGNVIQNPMEGLIHYHTH
ncbi:MAG: ATPase [Paludibacteraceae bacterium]